MPSKRTLPLSPRNRRRLKKLLEKRLTPVTRNKLRIIQQLADHGVSPKIKGLKRSNQHLWLKRYQNETETEALLSSAEVETLVVKTMSEESRPNLSKWRRESGLSRSKIRKIADLVLGKDASPGDIGFSFRSLLDSQLKNRKPGVFQDELDPLDLPDLRKFQANIVDIAGIFHDGNRLEIALGFHASAAFKNRMIEFIKSETPSIEELPWPKVSLRDMIAELFFEHLFVLGLGVDCTESMIDVAFDTWKNGLAKAFPAPWKLVYLVDEESSPRFSSPHAIPVKDPGSTCAHFCYSATMSYATAGIFPSIREWLLRLLGTSHLGLSTPISLLGSAEESMKKLRHWQISDLFWAIEGTAFVLSDQGRRKIRTPGNFIQTSLPWRPRISEGENKHVWIDPVPGIGFCVPWDAGDQALRQILNSKRKFTQVWYTDGTASQGHVSNYIDMINDYFRADKTDTDTKEKIATCHLLPRRYLFEDATENRDKYCLELDPSVQEHKASGISRSPDCLVYDAFDIVLEILGRFSFEYFKDIFQKHRLWQTSCLSNLDRYYFHNVGFSQATETDFEMQLEKFVKALIKYDALRRKKASGKSKQLENYELALCLERIPPCVPDFSYDMDTETLKSFGPALLRSMRRTWIWTPNFRNLFYHFDADTLTVGALCGGLPYGIRSDVDELFQQQTRHWQESVAVELHEMRKEKGGKFANAKLEKTRSSFEKKGYSTLRFEEYLNYAMDSVVAFHGKIIRMAIENISRQIVKGEINPDTRYVLPHTVLADQLVRTIWARSPEK